MMLNYLPSRGCVRMCALARGHTHGSVAFSVYPCLPLGPPRGAPCLVGVIAATRRPCTRMATTKKTPDSDDDEMVAIVVARLPCVRMDNPSSTQDTREPRERDMQSEEARVSDEIDLKTI